MEGIKKRTISGIKWNGLASGINQGFSIVFGIMLARLLPPWVFGMIAMIRVFTGFANVITNSGFAQALIQRKEIEEDHKHSMFWFNLAIGIFLFLIIFFCAEPIANFYNEPRLLPLVQILSLQFPLIGSHLVHKALLQKELKFKQIAFINIGSAFISGGVSLVLAFYKYGVWALVWGSMASIVFRTIGTWVASDYLPKFKWNGSKIKSLLGFGAYAFGNQSLNYWTKRVDNLLVGKLLGSAPLGIYAKAYQFLLRPINSIKGQVANVAFPTFSMIQDRVSELKGGYNKASQILILLLGPIMLGVLGLSERFVYSLLGQRWAGMIPLLEIFCVVGVIASIGLPGPILQARNRMSLFFRATLFVQILFIGGLVVGVLVNGILGAAYAVLIGYTIQALVMNSLALRELRMSASKYVTLILKNLSPSFFMLLCLMMVDNLLSIPNDSIFGFCLLLAIGAMVYFGFLFLFLRKTTMSIIKDVF